MTRIHIIGGPGSGKTTLARRLATQLRIPCYNLDHVGWEGGTGAERSLDIRLHDIHAIAIQADWVAEGWHGTWTDELLQAADQIVWLDLPWRIARQRIITRHMKASLTGKNPHRGLRKLYHFVGYARTYYTQLRWQKAQTLQPFMQKVVHCQHPLDVERFIKSVATQQ